MVSYDLFLKVVAPATGRNIDSNPNQKSIVSSPLNRSIKVIAGPGSGKTTVIALRLMKLIFQRKICRFLKMQSFLMKI